MDDPVVRTFDAPEALDVRFHEVHAKSAINAVPKASRMHFRWTVNPYRGCTHACTYCLAGDTALLLGDGSTKALRDVRVGDWIYGTRARGAYRRYERTQVLAHWRTRKPALRVLLEDGTELIASGDHRFLTRRGWKHVTGTEQGIERRPHLTVNDRLLGMGRALKSKTKLRVVAIEPLAGVRTLYDITTGTGDFIANGVVSHNCFARPTHTYLDLNAREDFEREIIVKVNTPERVRADLRKPSWKGELVALGTNTDPYQWVESKYKLTRGVWEALRDYSNPCSVLTKSPLLLRDLDLFRELVERTDFSANLSIPTLDEKTWRLTEPHTPHPRKRIDAVAELTRNGIPSSVLIAPLMPGINDSPQQVEELLGLVGEAGATSVTPIGLHLRGEVREIFFDWLRQYRPDLLERYEELYAKGAYLRGDERKRLARLGRGRSRAA
jgi:DNA repair photolyase